MSTYRRVDPGERVDAGAGSIVGVWPGAVLDMCADNGRRFIAEEDSSLREITDEG
jgi:hypothetical protein